MNPETATNLFGALEDAFRFIDISKKPHQPNKKKNGEKDGKPKDGKPVDTESRYTPKIAHNAKSDPRQNVGGADTIWLLTDGAPTYGKFVDLIPQQRGKKRILIPNFKKQIALNWLKDILALKPVKIHTIAVGNPGSIPGQDTVDTDLLQRIAQMSGGTFVHVIKN